MNHTVEWNTAKQVHLTLQFVKNYNLFGGLGLCNVSSDSRKTSIKSSCSGSCFHSMLYTDENYDCINAG